MVKQFKENQKHINPKRFKGKMNQRHGNNILFREVYKGPGNNNNRGNARGRRGKGRGSYGTK